MKAIVVREFGGPEQLRTAEVPDPVPGPGQVRVAVHAAGVNPVDAGNRADGSWAGLTVPCIDGAGGYAEQAVIDAPPGASGGVGLFLMQLAAASGIAAIGVGRRAMHEQMLSLGAVGCIDYIDCKDPELLARFWAAALGYVLEPPPKGRQGGQEPPPPRHPRQHRRPVREQHPGHSARHPSCSESTPRPGG